MRHGKLTRQQAIDQINGDPSILGEIFTAEEWLDRVESVNCEPTSRLQTDGDESVEYQAAVTLADKSTHLLAYYYTTPDEEQTIADHDGDGGAIDWTINGYEIV